MNYGAGGMRVIDAGIFDLWITQLTITDTSSNHILVRTLKKLTQGYHVETKVHLLLIINISPIVRHYPYPFFKKLLNLAV